ncbi:MAG: DUF4442 domain-containing protein, partial [Pseudomonadota bacterium]
QFAVAEVLGGLVGESLGVLNDQHVGVVKNFEIHFKKPATTDVIAETRMPVGDLTALAERIEADGRVDFDLEAAVTDMNGNTVAVTKGTYAIRPSEIF